MANNTTASNAIPNSVFLFSVVFKFIAMIIGVLGNVTVLIHTIFCNKEKTATSYLVGNLAFADLLMCLTFYPTWIIEFIQTMLNIVNDQDLFCKFSRATTWTFMFASVATLLAITVDRYLYIVKPLRYPRIVTRRRVFLVVSGIWITACCIFVVWYIHVRIVAINLRSACTTKTIRYFTEAFGVYLPLILIIFLNIHLLSVARKQRKRIFRGTTITSADNSTEKPANRMSFVLRFFVALKLAKTFAIVVAVLTICILTPTVVGRMLYEFCTLPCRQFWYVVFNFELYGINSIVNAFIYGMRHVKYRKAYLRIIFKLFSCRKATK